MIRTLLLLEAISPINRTTNAEINDFLDPEKIIRTMKKAINTYATKRIRFVFMYLLLSNKTTRVTPKNSLIPKPLGFNPTTLPVLCEPKSERSDRNKTRIEQYTIAQMKRILISLQSLVDVILYDSPPITNHDLIMLPFTETNNDVFSAQRRDNKQNTYKKR